MPSSFVLLRRGFIERLWLGFVFFLPLVFGPGLNDAFALPKVTLLRCGCAVFLTLCAARAAREGRIPLRDSALNRPLLFFLIAAFVSLLGAAFKSTAFWGMPGDYSDGWTSLLCYLVLFWLASSGLGETAAWETVDFMALSAGLAALYGLSQAAGFDFFVWRDGQAVFGRPWSTLGNPNFFGAFLAMSAPLALDAQLARPAPWRALAASLALAALPFTFSKGALTALLAGLAVWAWWRRVLLRGDCRPFVRIFVLAGAIALSLTAWRARHDSLSARPAESLMRQIGVKASLAGSSIQGRLIMWKTGARMFLGNPLIGIGPAGFTYHFRRWMDPEFETALSAGLSASHAHNEILDTAVSLGFFGLAAYFWVGCRLLGLARRLHGRSAQETGFPVAGAAAALAAVWVNNQFSFHTVTTAAYACVLMGFLARQESPERLLALPGGFPSGKGFFLAASALGFAALPASLSFLAANRFYRRAEDAYHQRADWREAAGLARAAARLDPFSSAYRVGLGRLLQEGVLNAQSDAEKRAFFLESVDWYEGVARRTPLNALAQNGLGVTFIHAARQFGEPEYLSRAEGRFRLALAADPYFFEATSNLAGCLYLQGRKDEVVAVYKEAIARQPKSAALHLALGDFYEQEGRAPEAMSQWQNVLRYDSNNEEAQRRLAHVWGQQGE